MKIAQLYTYPIKSLRPHELQEAQLTRHGFHYDRRFMLLQVVKDDNGAISYKNMHVSQYSEMVLFSTKIHFPSSSDARDGSITVTFNPPGHAASSSSSSIKIPLQPDFTSLAEIDVEMHGSSTSAYSMGATYNDWFSGRFGFEVVLAYLGDHHRTVLMSTSPDIQSKQNSGWLSAISNATTSLFAAAGESNHSNKEITFADCAPYLVVSEKSMEDVHNRLPEGQLMDISKFRPSIVVSGADQPWEEDYWGEITINNASKIACIHNCARCVSINVDYATGRPSTDAAGKMLSKLQKDRRVDTGSKYSPIFGRYSFLQPGSEGDTIKIGDNVEVSRINKERTTFDWEGLST